MNTNEIEQITKRVNSYKERLQTKRQLESEKQEWEAMYLEVQDMVKEVQEKYNQSQTDEDKALLDSWLVEEKAYVELLDEYTTDLEKINQELGVYRDSDYQIELQYLENVTRYREIEKRIQFIEEESRKAISNIEYQMMNSHNLSHEYLLANPSENKGKFLLGINGIQNYILPEYVAEYTKLVSDQRELSKKIEKEYNLIYNGYIKPVKEELINQTEVSQSENSVNQSSDIINVDSNDSIEKQYEDLEKIMISVDYSDEDKIRVLESFMHNIENIKNAGELKYATIDNKMVKLPKNLPANYIGYYSKANRWLENIQNNQENNNNFADKNNQIINTTAEPSIENKSLKNQYQDLEKIITSVDYSDEDKIKVLKNFMHNIETNKNTGRKNLKTINGKKVYLPTRYIGYYQNANRWLKNIQDNLNKQEEVESKTIMKYPIESNDDMIDINEYATTPATQDDFLQIVETKKPKNKEALKNRLKRIVALVAASTIAAGFLIANVVSRLSKGSSKPQIEVAEVLETETLGTEGLDDINEDIVNNQKHTPKEKKSPEKKETAKSSEVTLDATVTIKEGSQIYRTAKDSVYHTNGEIPYFSYDTSNDVVGITLKSNDKIASFVQLSSDPNTYEVTIDNSTTFLTRQEAEKKIQQLTSKGWQVAGTAVKNENAESGITGFYNINDISGGKIR